jgi:hypothetical protein
VYCLSVGKPLPKNVASELLAFIDKGHAWRQQFVAECLTDPDRFEKPLTRREVKNCASTGVKVGYEQSQSF